MFSYLKKYPLSLTIIAIVIYLSFFKRMPQHEIGRRYGRSRSAAGYHIRKAIQQLYEEMEGLAHEE